MNIKITVEAPGLVGAIESLALALSGSNFTAPPSIDGLKEEGTISSEAMTNIRAEITAAEREAAKKVSAEKEAAEKEAAALKARQEAEKREKDENAALGASNPDSPGISLQTVKDKLIEFSRKGKQAELKELITSFGAKKLSDIPEDKYAELIEKADALL